MHQLRFIINTALWTVQVLWGIFFSLTGFGKVLCYKPALWNQALQEVPWFSAVPQDLFIFIGVCEFLKAVGLILPAMTGVKPKLTPFACEARITFCPPIWCWEGSPRSSRMLGCL